MMRIWKDGSIFSCSIDGRESIVSMCYPLALLFFFALALSTCYSRLHQSEDASFFSFCFLNVILVSNSAWPYFSQNEKQSIHVEIYPRDAYHQEAGSGYLAVFFSSSARPLS